MALLWNNDDILDLGDSSGRGPQYRRVTAFWGDLRGPYRALHLPGHPLVRETGVDLEDEERGEGAQR